MMPSMQATLLGGVLVAAVLASSIGCVFARHEARKLFTELQQLNAERDRLEVDWGRLQIEQSTWSTHARVEQLARGQMQMMPPDTADIRFVAR